MRLLILATKEAAGRQGRGSQQSDVHIQPLAVWLVGHLHSKVRTSITQGRTVEQLDA
jgi:hypothetical protein